MTESIWNKIQDENKNFKWSDDYDSLTLAASDITTTGTIATNITDAMGVLIEMNSKLDDIIKNEKTFTTTANNNLIITDPFLLTNIEILSPNKVIRFTFEDGTQIKTICDKDDTFDFEFAFYLAYAKKCYGKHYTPKGLENKAYEFSTVKRYVKYVTKGMKLYKKLEKEKEDKKRKEKELKEIRQRQKEKKIRKKMKRKNASE